MMNNDFVELRTDGGPMIIRKDKIVCVFETKDGKCMLIPSDCDLLKITVLESYSEVVKQLLF